MQAPTACTVLGYWTVISPTLLYSNLYHHQYLNVSISAWNCRKMPLEILHTIVSAKSSPEHLYPVVCKKADVKLSIHIDILYYMEAPSDGSSHH